MSIPIVLPVRHKSVCGSQNLLRETEMEAQAKTNTCEVCDFCEEFKPIRFANVVRGFCSVACVNGYLKHEGFSWRLCINCEKQKVQGGQFVCCECLRVT